MNVVVYLGHPAHFWLFKIPLLQLKKNGHNIIVLIKNKEMLETLLRNANIPYTNILKEGRSNSIIGLLVGTLKRIWRSYHIVKKNKYDLLIGTSVENSFVGPLCNVPVVYCGEDDLKVAPIEGGVSYPGANNILTPKVCNNGKWDKNGKSLKYQSYHELAYLHPNHFIPNVQLVEKYGINISKPYFIIRFVSLTANHDAGIKGINSEIAQNLIDILKSYGQIYITSERELEPQFEQYRIKINPLDMHHVMAFASLYIGDSQTMAAEAGVLGVPFVRFNDFVGRIGYLRELEDVYHLGYGIRANTEPFTPEKVDWIDDEPKVQPCGAEAMYKVVKELMAMDADERRKLYQERRQKMLSEKIDYAKFLTWFIENYPESVKIMKENPDYQYNFR